MSSANPAAVGPASDTPNPEIGRTLNVHFSDPSPWARFAARPKTHWKLVGRGEISLSPEKLILRGRRPRFLWTAAAPDIEITLSDIINVTQANNLVQCHVRFANSTDKVLQLWVQDEAAARQITELLPKKKTPEFQRVAVEQAAFNSALESLQTRSVVTPTLVAANCVIFACTVFAGAGLLRPDGALLVHWGTNFGPLTLQGEWWRLFTSMFLHFGLIHLLLNMWALWSLGRLTERLYGSVHFALLYVFAGLFGSIASLLWRSEVNSAGASGAIFGVIGGLLAFMVNPKTQIPASIATAQRNSALVFVCYNLINGFAHAGIDNACHIGGLVGGFAMGWLLARPLDPEHREDPAAQLAVASFMGVLALIGLSWPLVHHLR
jgi:rhomboid protease GluP